jgi:hypothetical protein
MANMRSLTLIVLLDKSPRFLDAMDHVGEEDYHKGVLHNTTSSESGTTREM